MPRGQVLYELVPIKTKKALHDIRKLRRELKDALESVGKGIDKDWKDVVSTFDHSVTFTDYRVRSRGGDFVSTVKTDDEVLGHLDQGTSQRWAVMNKPYSPKTSMGAFKSSRGARTFNRQGYYTAIRGKRAMMARNIPPRPGIQARRYSIRIARKWRPVLTARVRLTIGRNIRRR